MISGRVSDLRRDDSVRIDADLAPVIVDSALTRITALT